MNHENHPIHMRDALGGEITLAGPPRRVVSLVPSITETLIDLGIGERLVGITNYCVHPQNAVAHITKVGGTKGPSFDTIDALAPDLIIANKEENRKRHVERLRERYPVFVTDPRTVDDALRMIGELGRLTALSAVADKLAASGRLLLTSLPGMVVSQELRTVCLIWRDPWMAVGPDTYVDDLLARVGLSNVFTAPAARYPETSLETVTELAPEVILLPDEPYAFAERDQQEIGELLALRGGRARVLLVNGSYLTWFGSRTLEGLRYLVELKKRLLEV
jgi:ABC-type Fe3+-hydroxamate transport system substrate-binding protein